MFGFGKKSKKGHASQPETESEESAKDPETAPVPEDSDEKTAGPWDINDEDAPDFDAMINIGAMYLPALDGAQLRLKAQNTGDTQTIIGATLTVGDSSLELEAFAAPKTMGLWDDIRSELIGSNAKAEEVDGTFGAEVLLPVKVKDKEFVSRIVGIDGPRWMLRGIFTGPAAREGSDEKTVFDDFFSEIVVDRGSEPLAPRDLIPMTVPHAPQQDDDSDGPLEDKAKRPAQPDGYDVQTTVQTSLTRGPLFSELR